MDFPHYKLQTTQLLTLLQGTHIAHNVTLTVFELLRTNAWNVGLPPV